jgi:SNF2 family DNA or RNA helicase
MIWQLWKGFFEKKGGVDIRARIGKKRPTLTLTIRDPKSGRRARLQVPPSETPEMVLTLRKLNGSVRMGDRLKAMQIHRKPLTPRVDADYDERQRLVMRPVYQNGEKAFTAEEIEKGRIKGTRWFWDGTHFRRIGRPARAVASFFDPSAKLVYEGDEIGDFLNEEFDKLSDHVAFRASEKLKKSRIARAALSALKFKIGSSDWYEVDLRFTAGELKIALGEILKIQGKPRYVRRGDVWIELESVEKELKELSKHNLKIDADGIRMHRTDVEEVKREERAAPRRRFRIEVEQIRNLEPAPIPKGLKATLRNYQQTGLDWLWWLRTNRMGGILADDMGLGKTHQSMAALMNAYERGATGPSLVVCPASVVDHWYRKIREFAPTLMPYVHHGSGRMSCIDDFAGLRVVLTTFGLLQRDIPVLSGVDWEYVILDEAHLIKNPTSSSSKAARQLRAKHRLALTGTPIENRPIELWSIMDFAMPGYLGKFERFREEFEDPIVKDGSEEALDKLREKIEPFKLRRLKEDVLDELPSKTEDKIYCEMSRHQEALYKAVVEKRAAKAVANLRGTSGGQGYMDAFATLTRLKQICNHPILALESGDLEKLESGKFEAFKELLQTTLDSGQKVVVFSQYVRMLRIMEQTLREKGVPFSILTGSTRDRADQVRRFHDDPARRVFLCSLLAGGCGIDLQCASVVIHYDRWWNKSKEDQATDRVHRMGQTRGVTVYKLITRRTVEEKIDRLISAKGAMFDAVIQSERDIGKAISREDLIQLLS